jgi:hypothetical protein
LILNWIPSLIDKHCKHKEADEGEEAENSESEDGFLLDEFEKALPVFRDMKHDMEKNGRQVKEMGWMVWGVVKKASMMMPHHMSLMPEKNV